MKTLESKCYSVKFNLTFYYSLRSSKLNKRATSGKIRGYSNIMKKSKEDLIQIVNELKEQNNAKDKVIHYLKVRNEKMRQNK